MQPRRGSGGVGRCGRCLREPLVQLLPNLVGGVGAPRTFRSHDESPGGGDARDAREAQDLPQLHGFTVLVKLDRMNASRIDLDTAVDATRTGDIWIFRGRSAADRAIQTLTNSPVNHVGMAVVVDDLPPLMWHAELGKSLQDMWTGNFQRGVQLHDLRAAVLQWTLKYEQRCWLRQLGTAVTREQEDALMRTIARMDGTAFPTTAKLAGRWFKGRVPTLIRRQEPSAAIETAYCAEVVATTYESMGLLAGHKKANWFDPGKFWSGDRLPLADGVTLGDEIAVDVPHEESPTAR